MKALAYWLWWDWFDGSLSVREARGAVSFRTLFRLWPFWCYTCHRVTLGCREHWFCGTCQPCRDYTESDRG